MFICENMENHKDCGGTQFLEGFFYEEMLSIRKLDSLGFPVPDETGGWEEQDTCILCAVCLGSATEIAEVVFPGANMLHNPGGDE